MLYENSVRCSEPFPYDEIDAADQSSTQAHRADVEADKLEFARRLVSFIRGKDRCRVTVDCLYLALGDADLEAITMTSIAADHGLTKAAISKRTKEIRQQLHLSINANNKSPHATQRYRETNRSPIRLLDTPGRVPSPPPGARSAARS